MQKLTIQNKHNLNLAVVVDEVPDANGIAFVMHGLGGFKEQLHVQTFAAAFREKGYTTIMFDTTNTLGESDGQYEDATVTNYYSDLEDVINWAKGQEWYQEPFFLAGHSIGSMCITLYAENHPEEVIAIAPTSVVVSGELNMAVKSDEVIKNWKETGWRVTESVSKPGVMKRLKWSHVADKLQYDLFDKIDQLHMPVLLIVGEKDTGTPLLHHEMLRDRIPGDTELHVITRASHNFKTEKELSEVKRIFHNWIDTVEST